MKELKWERRIPIFKNSLILKQMSIAIGIPFGILTVFLAMNQAYYALMMIAVLFLLTFLLVMLVFRGTYDVSYSLNENEILCETQDVQKNRVKQLSKLTFIVGLLKGNPTIAGAGLLSATGTKTRLTWGQVKKTKYLDHRKIVYVYGGVGKTIALFCSEANYMEVKQLIMKSTGEPS